MDRLIRVKPCNWIAMEQRESSRFIARYLISEKGNRVHVPFAWVYAANLLSGFPPGAPVNGEIIADAAKEVNINPLFAQRNRFNVGNLINWGSSLVIEIIPSVIQNL